jgi:NAD(P)-dependent dehydrogenase (short-subunit alcohol dehydrogenase family)
VVDGNSDAVTRLGTGTATGVGYTPDAIAVSGLAARSTGAITGTIRNVAVSALSKNLADELGKDGINVTVVHPGVTVTEQSPEILALRAARAGVSVAGIERRLGAAIGIGRLVTAEEVAAVVVFLASPKSVAINGDAIAVGGGADRPALLLSPRGPWA